MGRGRVQDTVYLGEPTIGKDVFAHEKVTRDYQHQFRNTPEQNIASSCPKPHPHEVGLHFQRLIKLHATVVWNTPEVFSEFEWAARLMQVRTQTLLRVAEE